MIEAKRVVGEPTPPITITIRGLSEDMAERLMALVGGVDSESRSETDDLYRVLKKALNKPRYGESKYVITHGGRKAHYAYSLNRKNS